MGGSELWYSFNAGLAHVIMLCSYCRTEVGSMQYSWLEKDLQRIDRAATPWVLTMTHVPWYTSSRHHSMKEGMKMRHAMEALLYAHKIDAFIVGHLHAYERTHGIYRNAST